ncbi:MAG TPA: VOC family protein [Mycobacteriales bacterium]|nr:VOC family protein [Mycobacteriales bacterium]
MTDPFDALREPVVPADPDPAFAAALRARLERALALPRGVQPVTVTMTATTLVPYLAVPAGTGRDALDWYAEVLGARLAGEPITMPDGTLGHAELDVQGATVYLAEEFPDLGVVAPSPDGTPVSLSLRVDNVAETMRLAVSRGGRIPRAMYDDHGSRNVTVIDPFGHRWLLHTPLAALPDTERPGDVGYLWISSPDPDRAAGFYRAVLGWDYTPGHVAGGRNVVGQSLPMGIGPGEPGVHLSYAVEDVAAAVERVRAAGGSAGEPEDRPYGTAADGTDDQGVAFSLHRAGAAPRSPENGARPGDLSYLTLEVVDSARARAFYGAVLGWTFDRGTVADGWTPQGVSPMTGMHGGNEQHSAVPMWKVADVPAAVERVRAAGGTATDPEQQPYGITADCRDDQGLRFYLGDS